MRASFMTIVLALLTITAFTQKTFEKHLYQDAGFVLKEFTIRERDMNTTMYVAVIDPSFKRAKVEGITKVNSNGCTALDMVKRNKASVVLGSGFVTSFYPLIPNGFLKIDNKVISPLKKKGYNGIVGIKKGKLMVLSFDSRVVTELDEGFQTGPFLLRDGKVVYNRESLAARDLYNRAFIGVNVAGKIIAAVTTEPVSLLQLSDFLASTNLKDLRCIEAVNLSGGGSETLVVLGKGKLFTYGSFTDSQSALIAFY